MKSNSKTETKIMVQLAPRCTCGERNTQCIHHYTYWKYLFRWNKWEVECFKCGRKVKAHTAKKLVDIWNSEYAAEVKRRRDAIFNPKV